MATQKLPRNRWVDAVSSMIELTQEGKLKWTTNSESDKAQDDKERTTPYFLTTYKDKALRLYEKRVPVNTNSITASLYSITGEEPPKWRRNIILEFIDGEGHNLWTFPEIDALPDLLSSVQYQVSGVNDFLDDIISEARNIPKRDSAKAQKEMIEDFNKRGEALSQIIQILDNNHMNLNARVQKAKEIAHEAIFKPTF